MGSKSGLSRREAITAVAGGAMAGVAGSAEAALAREANPAAFHPAYLRTEWLLDPVGIDTLRPRFTWELQGAVGRGGTAGPARVRVASHPRKLAARADVWDSGWVTTSRPGLSPEADLPLKSHHRYWWSVEVRGEGGAVRRSAEPATFVTGLVDQAEWRGRWLAAKPDPVLAPHIRGWAKELAPDDTRMPIFRRDFEVKKRLARAIVSVSGLGHYVLRINGKPVTESLLNPGWTDYRKTILYNSYDVSAWLKRGANALGLLLGNGFFNVEKRPGRYTKLVDSFGAPKFILQMSLFYEDGSFEQVTSDSEWLTAPGPLLWSSIYSGEDVDARREPPGWDRAGFAAGGWSKPLEASAPGGRLRAQSIPAVTIDRRLEPVAITQPKPGVFVYDFGLNFSGRPELAVSGPAGSRVRILPGESLGEDGLVSQRSYGVREGYQVWFDYTLAGRGRESFMPQFTYHGFRYLQVETRAGDGGVLPRVASLVGQFVFTSMTRAGTFESGNELMTRIHRLIEQAALSNSMSVLTDCPQREKLGWLEQAHLNAATIFYNRDAAALYEKIAQDIADAQQPDGMVPGIAPEYVAFIDAEGKDQIWRNSPEWGAAAILAPWAAYRAYGDRRILEKAYAPAVAYADYLTRRSDGLIVDFGMGDWYDIGPRPPGPAQLTSRALTGTAMLYQSLVALAPWARIIGRSAEALDFNRRAKDVAAAFNRRFFKAEANSYDTGSQTANAIPLALDLVPQGRDAAVLESLVASIRANGNGVTAGDVGFLYVVQALAKMARDDVMFDMMSVTDRPGYAYQLARGATSLTESWDANPRASLNHFMLGHGEGWLFGSLAGVRVDFLEPRQRIITIAPRPVGKVPSARATYRSPFGEIASAWERRGALLAMDVTIPAGAEATIIVPTSRPDDVREGGSAAAEAPGVRSVRPVPQGLELVVGPGRYRLAAPA